MKAISGMNDGAWRVLANQAAGASDVASRRARRKTRQSSAACSPGRGTDLSVDNMRHKGVAQALGCRRFCMRGIGMTAVARRQPVERLCAYDAPA